MRGINPTINNPFINRDLLHIAFELMDGPLVQISTEERKQVGGQQKGFNKSCLGELPGNMEYCVRPKRLTGSFSLIWAGFTDRD